MRVISIQNPQENYPHGRLTHPDVHVSLNELEEIVIGLLLWGQLLARAAFFHAIGASWIRADDGL